MGQLLGQVAGRYRFAAVPNVATARLGRVPITRADPAEPQPAAGPSDHGETRKRFGRHRTA